MPTYLMDFLYPQLIIIIAEFVSFICMNFYVPLIQSTYFKNKIQPVDRILFSYTTTFDR